MREKKKKAMVNRNHFPQTKERVISVTSQRNLGGEIEIKAIKLTQSTLRKQFTFLLAIIRVFLISKFSA